MKSEAYQGFQITTYVINLPERVDRKTHIEKQFFNKPEFLLQFITAETHPIGAVGLWKSIVKIVIHALHNTTDDVILICEDDHTFTDKYDREKFFYQILQGAKYNTHIIFGGIGGGHNIVATTKDLYWVDMVWCTQFIVIFREAFPIILESSFTESDVADEFLSKILPNKLVIWPFISVQSEFGYSDVTECNTRAGNITQLFKNMNQKFERYNAITKRLKALL